MFDPIVVGELDSDDEWITEKEDPTLPTDPSWLDGEVLDFKNPYDQPNPLFEVQDNASDDDDDDSLDGDLLYLMMRKKWKNEVVFYFYACLLLYLFKV